MNRIKYLTDKLRCALYGSEVRSAIIESFEVVDKRIKWLIAISALQGVAIIVLGMKLFLL